MRINVLLSSGFGEHVGCCLIFNDGGKIILLSVSIFTA